MALFLAGFLLSLSLCLDLGLVNVALIRTGLERGALSAFALGLGSCFGDLAYAGLSAAGLALLLQLTAVRWAVWLGGTAVLLYLTYQMVRGTFRPTDRLNVPASARPEAAALHADFGRGVALALASPSAIVWFAALGGSVVASTTGGSASAGLATFFAGFFVAGCVWSLALALVSGVGRTLLGPPLVRGLSVTAALLFLYFAVKVFLDGYRTLL